MHRLSLPLCLWDDIPLDWPLIFTATNSSYAFFQYCGFLWKHTNLSIWFPSFPSSFCLSLSLISINKETTRPEWDSPGQPSQAHRGDGIGSGEEGSGKKLSFTDCAFLFEGSLTYLTSLFICRNGWRKSLMLKRYIFPMTTNHTGT